MRAVVGVKVVGQIPEVVHQGVRRALHGALLDDLGIEVEPLDQQHLLRLGQPGERGAAVCGVVRQAAFLKLSLDAGDAGMGVLDVVHGVVVRARLRQFQIEIQMLVVAAHDVEQPRGVVAHFAAQIAQGDEFPGARRHLRLLAAAKQRHELHQPHLEAVGRTAERSQAGPQSGDIAVVVGTPDIQEMFEPALALVEDERDVGGEIGLDAVVADHHTVFLVAVFGALEPQRPILAIGAAG